MARKGDILHAPELPHIEEIVNGKLGEKNLAGRSLGISQRVHLASIGAHNACWSKVNLTGQDLNNVPVPHSLGEVPVLCTLAHYENSTTPGTFLIARAVSPSSWTVHECRVAINVVAGSATGCLAEFQVWGA